jgi:hypothetical protein
LTGVLFLVLIITGCKKSVGDEREKYIGDWQFKTYIYESWVVVLPPKYDTINFEGTIEYGSGEKELIINYSSNISITISSDIDGVWRWYDSRGNPAGSGVVGRNVINFVITSGGQGHTIRHSINGSR